MSDQLVEVDGRRLKLSNLQKVLYPEAGFTKGQVIDYYARIAPVLLPHLKDRPVTLRRYPNGVDGQSFFEKNVARHAPEWVRTERLPTPGSSKGNEFLDFVLIEDLATLAWVANLAALELHVPQWKVGAEPDLLVFDLDPGAPATVVECCQVALWLREELAEGGYDAWPKTSGSKGMQLYVPLQSGEIDTWTYSRKLAERLAGQYPRQVVATMAKAQRGGKVFIDWSQNRPAKTTVAPYSLRARPQPTVSTPVTWQEVEECDHVEDLTFTADEVRARVDELGDLLDYL
ncbi:bifunctional non-homologous end joining protein LigD [Kibdelosporangium banguiense]|uniref:Bifunctional non-homologous end joining protein LigD n=1 Tax=Kibdelosporangium banguiense TaxID=1365924 RepID=A0ABS4U292_9PSEU|nr:non-homologous end-joining DNA ligase [Kibdelosporangium banguiense]MBP2330777.1 bifunctional non-homologous end joining protein LigD [Kibdelosporangium banguiense]